MMSDAMSVQLKCQNVLTDCGACVLIIDDVTCPGFSFLKSLILAYEVSEKKVNVVCFENAPKKLTRDISEKIAHNVKCVDYFSDPMNWDGTGNSDDMSTICQQASLIPDESILVIDSLTPILLRQSLSYTCKMLSQVKIAIQKCGNSQVVCLLHADMHTGTSVSSLCRIADSVICMHANRSIKMIQKRKTGKVIRRKFTYDVQPRFILVKFDETTLKQGADEKVVETVPDLASSLTFNLTLSENEKQARSKLTLPHIHSQSGTDMANSAPLVTVHRPTAGFQPIGLPSQPESGGGRVLYEPDEADDYDEEDPDDDLDV